MIIGLTTVVVTLVTADVIKMRTGTVKAHVKPVHGVKSNPEKGKRSVFGVGLVVINQIQHKYLVHHVLNVQQENVQEVGVQATDGQLQRLVIFVLKVGTFGFMMKNVYDVQQVNINHRMMFSLFLVKFVIQARDLMNNLLLVMIANLDVFNH